MGLLRCKKRAKGLETWNSTKNKASTSSPTWWSIAVAGPLRGSGAFCFWLQKPRSPTKSPTKEGIKVATPKKHRNPKDPVCGHRSLAMREGKRDPVGTQAQTPDSLHVCPRTASVCLGSGASQDDWGSCKTLKKAQRKSSFGLLPRRKGGAQIKHNVEKYTEHTIVSTLHNITSYLYLHIFL